MDSRDPILINNLQAVRRTLSGYGLAIAAMPRPAGALYIVSQFNIIGPPCIEGSLLRRLIEAGFGMDASEALERRPEDVLAWVQDCLVTLKRSSQVPSLKVREGRIYHA